jgi:hypothetical protein
MPEKNDGQTDWGALYRAERNRIPERKISPGIDRHFAWEASNHLYPIPIQWLEHYAPAFHFSDAEIWCGRTIAEPPTASGVYFLFDGERCVYVGQTDHFWQRFEQHKRNRVRWDSHAYIEVPKFFAPAVEAYYIRRIEPALNTYYPALATYSDIVAKLGLDLEA